MPLNEKLPVLEAYLREQYGGRFRVESSTVSIGTSLTRAITSDFERMGLTMINTGANDIHLTPNRSATTAIGILLGSNGGFLSLTAKDDLILTGWDWWGIATTAASTLLLIQLLRYSKD
jgi:hypothetical protein